MRFASDNTSGAAPEILDALGRANAGAVSAYGADPLTEALEARVAEVFERECRVFAVATGSAANSIALASMTPPWGAILCHRTSHIEEDECGAPEFFSGAKLTLIGGEDGRIAPERFENALRGQGARGVHQNQPRALSLTQATEAGTLYPLDHLSALCARAHESGLKTHMDGARFANALARTGKSPAEMTWKAGIDVLCLGATKNGAAAAEAIVTFDLGLAEEIAFRRKRGGHLFSKMRFVSAQLLAWLEDDLWLRLAGRANAMADRLAAGVAAIPGARLRFPVEANMAFVELPVAAHRALRAAGAAYYLEPAWQSETPGDDVATIGARLVCSFTTTEQDVDGFLRIAHAAVADAA